MKFLKLFSFQFIFLASLFCSNIDVAQSFEENEGCFLLFDLSENSFLIKYNPKIYQKAMTPCCTFNIANALIALDTKVIDNQFTKIAWDHSPYPFSSWEQNHTLQSAMKHSVVWYFKALANRIGKERYLNYLSKFSYGNQDISSEAENFWLSGSLSISPLDQLKFLNKLHRNELPVSQEAMSITRDILIIEQTNDWTLMGKTGTSENGIGWFVGYVESFGKSYSFVTCLRRNNASGKHAKILTQTILLDLGIIDSQF